MISAPGYRIKNPEQTKDLHPEFRQRGSLIEKKGEHYPETVLDPELISIPEQPAYSPVSTFFIEDFVNNYPFIDKLFAEINSSLAENGMVLGKAKTNRFYRKKYLQKKAGGRLCYFLMVLFHRVFPKLNRLFYKTYFLLTKGKQQWLSKTEVLGRLVKNGFDIYNIIEEENGELLFSGIKRRAPDYGKKFSYWPVFRMQRVGQNGKDLFVYKLRTMHPYAEYLQEYIKQQHGLEKSGKYLNDFRITSWGRFLRKCWIDELPMLVNLIKGDLKLVGVRPISGNFMKLYPEELKSFRNKFKPGLIPPYYADMPENFSQILLSERKYLQHYEKSPHRTDLKYFFLIARNILLKKARSK